MPVTVLTTLPDITLSDTLLQNLSAPVGYLRKKGFTILELLVVIAIVGILSAISAPVWLRFLAEQQVAKGSGLIALEIKKAQIAAQTRHSLWQFSVRQNGKLVEFATHEATALPSTAVWKEIDGSVQLDTAETTVLKNSTQNVYYIRFNEKGNVRGSSLGRVTLSSKQFSDVKRCVFISTLLGATRMAETQLEPDKGGRFCY
jgi:prepilin-type N-terminal cleavage/methylation domain-containing protein